MDLYEARARYHEQLQNQRLAKASDKKNFFRRQGEQNLRAYIARDRRRSTTYVKPSS